MKQCIIGRWKSQTNQRIIDVQKYLKGEKDYEFMG